MKLSRDGWLPQVELGPRLGGLKVLYQRAGSLVFQPITMAGAMQAAWSTTPGLQTVFADSLVAYYGSVALLGIGVMAGYYMLVLPSEQTFNQTQAHRSERSPLKRDTEAILDEVRGARTDGGGTDEDRGQVSPFPILLALLVMAGIFGLAVMAEVLASV